MAVVDTPDGMEFFRLLQFQARFKIEISTGLSHKLPTLKLYNQAFGTNFSRKAKALADCEVRINRMKEARTNPEAAMIYINGSKISFHCQCGCNIFIHEEGTVRYTCNACGLEYEGESNDHTDQPE